MVAKIISFKLFKSLSMKLEICANSIQSALNAQEGGADRIELCENLSIGGITPRYDLIKTAKEKLNIPIYVLIRPRGGDFNYSDKEIDQMLRDIDFCIENQLDGVVFGALNQRLEIAERITTQLMKSAGFLDVTYHRAFDEVPNKLESLDALRDMGVQRILTSGGKGNAFDNLDQLDLLIDEAADDIIIMPGGGIRPNNVKSIIDLGCTEVHSSCLGPMNDETDLRVVKELRSLIVRHSP